MIILEVPVYTLMDLQLYCVQNQQYSLASFIISNLQLPMLLTRYLTLVCFSKEEVFQVSDKLQFLPIIYHNLTVPPYMLAPVPAWIYALIHHKIITGAMVQQH